MNKSKNVASMYSAALGRQMDVCAPSPLQLMALVRHAILRSTTMRIFGYALNLKDGAILDIGASVGQTCLLYGQLAPDKKIVAIEPSEFNIPYLKHNTKGFNVDILRVAVGDKREKRRLSLPSLAQKPNRDKNEIDNNSGMLSLYGGGDYSEEVDVVPLDDIICGPVCFIDIDVEGSEIEVLRGAKNIIEEQSPLLYIELSLENQNMANRGRYALVDEIEAMKYLPIFRYENNTLFGRKEDVVRFRDWQQSQGNTGARL